MATVNREDLEAQAKELGIKFNTQWADKTLAKRIDEALSEAEDEPKNSLGETEQEELDRLDEDTEGNEESQEEEEAEEVRMFASTHNGVFMVGDIEFSKGNPQELSDELLDLASTKHAIKTGMLTEVK